MYLSTDLLVSLLELKKTLLIIFGGKIKVDQSKIFYFRSKFKCVDVGENATCDLSKTYQIHRNYFFILEPIFVSVTSFSTS